MSEELLSIGLDVGTTSTQMILSRLTIENRASGFSVPEMVISRREILYRSPVHFTPLVHQQLVDGDAIRHLIEQEYQNAGITREKVDTGAIIITGETSRKENARTVLEALSHLAGEFVVTTAGPDLESVLAAKGSGAVEYAKHSGKTVLHMDIGGGTSNLALIRDGKILRTGCLNVGGRLVKLDKNGEIVYISPVLQGICRLKPGQRPDLEQLHGIAQTLTSVLEMAAGRRQATALLTEFTTMEAENPWVAPEENVVISFSGGVADCIEKSYPPLEFGDIGPVLGQAIRESSLCQGEYVLGRETIRATVIGAGCHSTQLSGSTVFHQNIPFPLKNVPVVAISDPAEARQALAGQENGAILAIAGMEAPGYRQIVALAQQLIGQCKGQILLCMEQDMAKALGQALAVRLPPDARILCIDRVRVGEGCYLDIGAPVGHALPVVVKTLVLGR